MYESEVNKLREAKNQIPADVLRQFAEPKDVITHRTILPWSEHCTECVWPTCYTTCDLYSSREDGRCRRFLDGMVRVDGVDGVLGYLLKIRFKRWGKLWTEGNVHLFSREEALALERRDQRFGRGIQLLPLQRIRKQYSLRRYDGKKAWARGLAPGQVLPSYFLLECYNPQAESVDLTLEFKGQNERMPFLSRMDLSPGFNRERISYADIAAVVDLHRGFQIAITPNEAEEGTTLYFGTIDFVADPTYKARVTYEPTKKCKCLVWDLDNTLWQGTLVEDGAEKLELRPGVVEVIKELDQRGILHSIASKNNHEDAVAVLARFGLEDYFLYPQISWGPKSAAINRIAAALNIGRDTLIFIDDTSFERAQIEIACPDVRTIDAAEYSTLLEHPDFQVDVTADGQGRRQLYKEQAVRASTQDQYDGDYFDFLRDCKIQLTIRPMAGENLQRVHELTQRTNQMNFSGNRYHREALQEILAADHLDTFVLDCEDRFGNYGTVGFCVVGHREPRMIDLMFSCRIQSRRVEHAFLTYLLKKYRSRSSRDFHSNYFKTARNAPSGKVFDDFGFVALDKHDEVTHLVFSCNNEIPDDNIVDISDSFPW